ncbi:MAG: response regulator [Lachnospiraceae bacterium]|nr:response regulator [Lachnospiraceae bacterium]
MSPDSSFEKSESSVEGHIQGTGLGLTIVKGLVEAMGGTISIESEPQKGSTFTVEVPQGISDSRPAGPIAKDPEKTAEEKDKLKKQPLFEAPDAHILAVDDNDINLAVLSALLKRTKINIDTALGGAEAIEMSKEKKYDLIFMDHMMPDPDGIETLHRIRNDTGNPNKNTPEVALTANAIAGAEKMYIDEGFDAYLTKPVNPQKIEKLIKDILPAEKIKVLNDH